MDKVEQINLYAAGLTLTTVANETKNVNVWFCDELQATMLPGGYLKIFMIREGQRITWEYYGAALVRWKGKPV